MYRTVATLDTHMALLAAFFPEVCTRVELPNRSREGRPIFALRIHAGRAATRRGVLIVGGMHARELMNPDAIAELQLDLIRAYTRRTGITIGGRSWSEGEIRIMLETLDIWLLPCANPDGREYAMNVDDLWRQNRADNPGSMCVGVDVNRNCDIVWGVTTSNTSCNPCTQTYVGPDRFSEPEARNIRDLCDAHRIDVFLDVHSFLGLVLYPWGHAPIQTTDPAQRFTTLTTGTCEPLAPAAHQEYMPPRDRLRFERVARRIAADIAAVRGASYTAVPTRDLYATTGTSSDYVYSRHVADPALRKTYGFAFETGPAVLDADGLVDLRASFHPADPMPIKNDAKAGMISLLQQSVCAIEFIGAPLFGSEERLEKVRAVRDRRLAATGAGRRWIALFERVQIPLLALVVADQSLTKEAMSLLDTAAALLDDDQSILTPRDAARGTAFIDVLAARTTSASVRRDLAAVRRQLQSAAGKRVRDVLDGLAGRG